MFSEHFPRTNVPPRMKGASQMSEAKELLDYIMTLTPEQAKKVFNQIPQLTLLLEESLPLCPAEQFSQTQ